MIQHHITLHAQGRRNQGVQHGGDNICSNWLLLQSIKSHSRIGHYITSESKKTETIHSSVIGHSSKIIRVIKLSFCQNDSPIGESFWQKDSLITHILFELWLITLLCIVLVFLTQTLCNM